MKIKLTRELWNHKKGDTMDVNDLCGHWAIKKGLGEQVMEHIEPITVKAIESDYQTKVIEVPKNKGGRPKTKQ